MEFKQILQDYYKISDIVFNINDRHFHLHKAILGSRSSWFEKLCVNGMFKESTQSIIEINIIPMDIFEIVIEYIYTGCDNFSPSIVLQVLITADEIDLKNLHQICEKEVQKTLNYRKRNRNYSIGRAP